MIFCCGVSPAKEPEVEAVMLVFDTGLGEKFEVPEAGFAEM